MASGHVNRLRGIFEVSEQCPNMPLNTCPCVSFVAPNVPAVTAFPGLSRRSRGLSVDSWDSKSPSVLARACVGSCDGSCDVVAQLR